MESMTPPSSIPSSKNFIKPPAPQQIIFMSPPSTTASPAAVSMASSFQSPRDSLTTLDDKEAGHDVSDVMITEDNKSNVQLWINSNHQTLSPPVTPREPATDLDQVILPPVRNATPGPAPDERPTLPPIRQWLKIIVENPEYAEYSSQPKHLRAESTRQEFNAAYGLMDLNRRSHHQMLPTRTLPRLANMDAYRRHGRALLPPVAHTNLDHLPKQSVRRSTGSGNSRRKISDASTSNGPRAGHRRKISQVDGANGEERVARRRNTNPNRPAKPQNYMEIFETHKHFLPNVDPEQTANKFRPSAARHRLRVLEADRPGATVQQRSDLSKDPDVHLVHPWEVELAEDLRMGSINQYYINKLRVFKRLYERRAERKGFTKTHAQAAGTVDVNKMSKLWEAYNRIGWFEVPLQEMIDERLTMLKPEEAIAAKTVVF